MANLTLNREDTALVFGGRSQITGDKGDLFMGIWDYANAVTYNPIRAKYLDLEDQIHAAIVGGFIVTGADQDGTPMPIGDDPDHPRPPQK